MLRRQLTCLLFIASLAVAGQASRTKPVPSSWLKGDALVLSHLNFSVRCPYARCRWKYSVDAEGDFTVFEVRQKRRESLPDCHHVE